MGYEEILSSLALISKKTLALSKELNKIIKKFDDEIDKAEKEPFLFIQDPQERQKSLSFLKLNVL